MKPMFHFAPVFAHFLGFSKRAGPSGLFGRGFLATAELDYSLCFLRAARETS